MSQLSYMFLCKEMVFGKSTFGFLTFPKIYLPTKNLGQANICYQTAALFY